jgi:hypothetical protein
MCALRAKIVDDKEDGEERIENTVEAADDVRRDFGRNPKGCHDFRPGLRPAPCRYSRYRLRRTP